jgi:hypothetical protein
MSYKYISKRFTILSKGGLRGVYTRNIYNTLYSIRYVYKGTTVINWRLSVALRKGAINKDNKRLALS